jgi:8-oxo-dGTP pyrophosphatase MutT (NUDIX family)
MATKPAWLYQQSAVIPFLKRGETLEVVLITAKSSGDWIIPKGVIERDMTPAESAAMEALTEAGVRGIVSEKLVSEYEYQKWGGTCHVQVFAMEVTEVLSTWEEENSRNRRIVEAAEAVSLVKPLLKDVLSKFVLQNSAKMP